MDLLDLDELYICPWALREGVILRRLDWMPGTLTSARRPRRRTGPRRGTADPRARREGRVVDASATPRLPEAFELAADSVSTVSR